MQDESANDSSTSRPIYFYVFYNLIQSSWWLPFAPRETQGTVESQREGSQLLGGQTPCFLCFTFLFRCPPSKLFCPGGSDVCHIGYGAMNDEFSWNFKNFLAWCFSALAVHQYYWRIEKVSYPGLTPKPVGSRSPEKVSGHLCFYKFAQVMLMFGLITHTVFQLVTWWWNHFCSIAELCSAFGWKTL